MNVFSGLPIVGRGSYESNFSVKVSGLDGIVEKAVSGSKGECLLGKAQMGGSVLSEVRVTLETGTEESGYGKFTYYSKPSYKLEAELVGGTSAQRSAAVDVGFLTKAGFEVTSGRKENDYLHIRCNLFPSSRRVAEYSGIGQPARLTYSAIAAGLTPEDVSRTVTGFAQMLQSVVNGMYKAARQASPSQTLTLGLGEQVRRIRGRTVDSREKVQQQHADAANGKGDELPPISLEAVTSSATFKDIGGYQGIKEQLGDFLLAIKNPGEARRHGYTPSRGWLLHGPSGTGKTLFGRALAGEAGAEFVYFNASDALQMYVGQSTKALKAAFEGAQERADETKKPVILFIDEIDSIFPKRGTAHDVKVDLVNLFNQYMDGFESKKIPNVYVVAATNRLDEMDQSATRAGRFVKIELPLPDLEARTAIFEVTKTSLEREAGTRLFDAAIDYSSLARLTDKFSGADVAQVMQQARQKAFRQAATAKRKDIVITSAADLEAQISAYRRQKQDWQGSSGKGPLGFGRHV